MKMSFWKSPSFALFATLMGALSGCATMDVATSDSVEGSQLASERPARSRRLRGQNAESASAALANGRVLSEQIVSCAHPPSTASHCPQCPESPSTASVVRGFSSVETAVLRCAPPTLANGKLAVAAQFENNGNAMSFRFPGVSVSAAQAQCLQVALCGVRVPTFQRASATIRYEYVVAYLDHQ